MWGQEVVGRGEGVGWGPGCQWVCMYGKTIKEYGSELTTVVVPMEKVKNGIRLVVKGVFDFT